MECTAVQKNINSFLKETLKGNELRKTYYHLKNCKKHCKEVLLDEFSFYTTFNDLDKDLNFNYEKRLNEFMNYIGNKIETRDTQLRIRYIMISMVACVVFLLILVVALRVVYR